MIRGTAVTLRFAFTLIAGAVVAVAGGCATNGGGSGSVGYGYGVYYGSTWNDPWYDGGPIYIGPPGNPSSPPGGSPPPSASSPRPSHPIARPMPRPRPTPARRGRR